MARNKRAARHDEKAPQGEQEVYEAVEPVEAKTAEQPMDQPADAVVQETEEEAAQSAAEDVRADVEVLESALAEANGKANEYLNMAQRVQADFDNYRRRNQNVRGEAFEDGAKSIILLLLPVLDNMERAMDAATGCEDKVLLEGVEMVSRQLREVFDKRGVKPIHRLGEKFDPNVENAVLTGTPEDGEAGTVCEVLQKGYCMGNAVLRHAMVKVVPE